MAQADQDVGNANGQTVRTDINNQFDALYTNNSGNTAPSVTSECMWFADKQNNQIKLRGKDTDTTFYVVGTLGQTNLGLATQASPSFTGNVAVPAGTASSLSVRFTGDTDTGFFKNAANDFSIVTGGTRRAHFDSNGITIRDRKALRLRDSSNSNFVAIQAPANATSDITLTLPDSDGNANDVLQSDGSGNLSFTALPQAVPTGSIHMMANNNVPSGYLKCNGQAVSRTTYAALYAVLGSTYGQTATTFNLPDLRGEFVRGWDDARGVDSGRGIGTTQGDQNRQHSHSTSVTSTVNDPGHNHVYVDQIGANEGYRPWKAGDNDCGQRNKDTHNNFTGITVNTTVTVNNDPISQSQVESRPRNISLLYVIKT